MTSDQYDHVAFREFLGLGLAMIKLPVSAKFKVYLHPLYTKT